MSFIRVIKTEKDYQEALQHVEALVAHDPNPESERGEQLALLSTLIKDYETRVFPETLPDPVEAIKYRMEQLNLKPTDLTPYLGSRSRVSEILSGKRHLTIEMIRALEEGLGIPAKVLIREPENSGDRIYEGWGIGLIREMASRGYFGSKLITSSSTKNLLKDFFTPIVPPTQLEAMFRKSSYRSSPLTDKHALAAWAAYVYRQGQKHYKSKKFHPGTLNIELMRKLLKLSTDKNGPILAQQCLADIGIKLIIEPHFPKTYLDGATILISKINPIIGLTLRHDRLDNFWFTLMHELAHVALHYDTDIGLFYDELEDATSTTTSPYEREADSMAEEAILPKAKWEISPARIVPSAIAANSLAKDLGVHVAIIAGQIRHKGNRYIYLNKIVNEAKVRHYFPNPKWTA